MGDMTLTCSICDESFSSEEELIDHEQTVHAAAVGTRRRFHEDEPDEQETAA